MRGDVEKQPDLIVTVSPEDLVPRDHPIRLVKKVADEALRRLGPRLGELYSERGRKSVPPEMLLRAQILIALYSVLGPGNPKKGEPGLMIKYLTEHSEVGSFFHIIPDISLTPQQVWNTHNYVMFVPYILLVLLFAVSIWLPQALMPGDKQQKMIGGYMAIVMLYFGWVSPAGVLLYWDISSIFGLAQQQLTMSVTKKELAQREADAAAEKAAEKEAKKKTADSPAAQVADKKPANKGSKKSKKS